MEDHRWASLAERFGGHFGGSRVVLFFFLVSLGCANCFFWLSLFFFFFFFFYFFFFDFLGFLLGCTNVFFFFLGGSLGFLCFFFCFFWVFGVFCFFGFLGFLFFLDAVILNPGVSVP